MFFALMLIVFVVIVTVNFVMFRLIDEITERDALRDMGNSVVAYHRFEDQRKELLITQAMAMSQTALLKATLEIEGVDSETIFFTGTQLLPIAATDLLLIVDDAGKLLSDIYNQTKTSVDLSGNLGIEQALYGNEFSGVWEYEGSNYHVAISPAISGNRVVGLVVLGQRLDSDSALKMLGEVTGTKVLLSVNNKIYTPSAEVHINDETQKSLLESLIDMRTGSLAGVMEGEEIRKIELMGDTHFAATIYLSNEAGEIVFYRSIDLIAAALRPFQLIVLASSGLIFLFGLFVSNWITVRISRPITKLTEVTKEFGKGNFEIRLQSESRDEVGSLTEAFNAMAEDITESRENLIESRKLAEAANQAKSDFLATMSHEIRTPMNGVIGIADLLMRTKLDKSQQKYIKILIGSSEELLEIVNDILDFSKIESGNLELDSVPFDMREHLENLLQTFANSANQKGLELICDIPPEDSFRVCGDPRRLNQVLINLIGNSIKFTSDGEIRVSLRPTQEEGILQFEVCDTGIGIREKSLKRIFQPFSQADSSATREYGGTGLGLSICKQLVSLMGGKIGCESKIGKGSIFWFTLPLPASTLDRPEASLSSAALLGNRALVVDDSEASRALLLRQLKIWGLDAQSAGSGSEALSMLRSASGNNEAFDLLLLDVEMPDMDGLTVADTILSDSELDDVKLLMLNTRAQDPKLTELQQRGAIRCLAKPICQLELFECLHVLLGNPIENELVHDEPKILQQSEALFSASVLVIDDNPLNLVVAQSNLQQLGCDVDIVQSGQEGIDAISNAKYDIVFMDCQMPGMDGFETTGEIRRYEKLKRSNHPLPIVALTANAIRGDRDRCLAAGMDDYLSKPFKQGDLVMILQRWLHTQPMAVIQQ